MPCSITIPTSHHSVPNAGWTFYFNLSCSITLLAFNFNLSFTIAFITLLIPKRILVSTTRKH